LRGRYQSASPDVSQLRPMLKPLNRQCGIDSEDFSTHAPLPQHKHQSLTPILKPPLSLSLIFRLFCTLISYADIIFASNAVGLPPPTPEGPTSTLLNAVGPSPLKFSSLLYSSHQVSPYVMLRKCKWKSPSTDASDFTQVQCHEISSSSLHALPPHYSSSGSSC